MPLALNVLRCPEGVAADRREVTAEDFSIGRGTDNDWVLPDRDKALSKRHCRITAQAGRWLVTDGSSNGTLLNGSALDRDLPYPLRDRDRLVLGRYEIEVRIGDNLPNDDPGEAVTRFGSRPPGLDAPRLTSDPFPALADDPLDAPVPTVGLSLDFDALGAGDAVAEHPYPQRDDAPAFDMPFRPPRPSTELLPADWDLDPEPRDATRPPVAAPAAAPLLPAAPSVAIPSAAGPPTASAPASAAAADDAARAGLAAFSTGAGVANVASGDPAAVLRGLGAAFRAVVSGLRHSMIARAAVKNEFRISQTMIRPSGNNPLKFAADDDDALAALLGAGRSGMDAEAALADALSDIQAHELAVASAMQAAVRDLLAELAPEKVERGVRRTALRGRKQAAWDAYVDRHAAVSRALADEFDSVFGRSFARAYEAALSAVVSKDDL